MCGNPSNFAASASKTWTFSIKLLIGASLRDALWSPRARISPMSLLCAALICAQKTVNSQFNCANETESQPETRNKLQNVAINDALPLEAAVQCSYWFFDFVLICFYRFCLSNVSSLSISFRSCHFVKNSNFSSLVLRVESTELYQIWEMHRLIIDALAVLDLR